MALVQGSNIGFGVAGAAAAAALTYLFVELFSGDDDGGDKAAWVPSSNRALVNF